MLYKTPPPIFKYDVADMKDLYKKTEKWHIEEPLPVFDLKNVITGDDVLEKLPEIVARASGNNSVLLVMDSVDMQREEKSLKPYVEEILKNHQFEVRKLVLEG